jgi:beta-lactamase class A
MMLDRRALILAAPALAAWPACSAAPAPPLAAYERQSGGRIGVFAQNLVSGASISWRAGERFVMCSTFKASLAGLVLARADAGREDLAGLVRYSRSDIFAYAPVASANLSRGAMSVAEMCAAAVEFSDNTCANLLLARVGGPAALTAFWRRTGDGVTRLDHNEPMLNRSPPGDPHDTTTPAAMAGTLRRLVLGRVLSPASRARLAGWMVDSRTGDDRLRAGLPTTWRIADKTGNNGKDAAGDIAVVWPSAATPVLICAYAQGGAPTPAQLTAVFTQIGRMVEERLG